MISGSFDIDAPEVKATIYLNNPCVLRMRIRELLDENDRLRRETAKLKEQTDAHEERN